MWIIGIVYLIATLITGIAVAIDKEKPDWTVILAVTVGWPIAIPLAAGYQIVKDILERRKHQRVERRRQILLFCLVARNLKLLSDSAYMLILRGSP